MTITENPAAPDHGTEHRPAEVLVSQGQGYQALDHGTPTAKDRYLADSEWGTVDYVVRLTRRNAGNASIDLLTISGARELARQLNASADEAEARQQADIEIADPDTEFIPVIPAVEG